MHELPFDEAMIFVGWVLLPIAVLNEQEYPSYNDTALSMLVVRDSQRFFVDWGQRCWRRYCPGP